MSSLHIAAATTSCLLSCSSLSRGGFLQISSGSNLPRLHTELVLASMFVLNYVLGRISCDDQAQTRLQGPYLDPACLPAYSLPPT